MTADTDTVLRLHRHDEVAVLTLCNTARLNPLGIGLQQQLRARLAELAADAGVRALVLTGEGKGFCVGADLQSMGGVPAGDGRTLGAHTADTMHALSNRLILDLQALPMPVVCAVNGAAAGAGAGLALAGDFTLMARSAYFLLPFLPRLGIVPDLGTTWFIERRLGRARAMGLALLGERLSAQQALDWGLVWGCADDAALQDEALALARRLARLPAHAAMEARRALDVAAIGSLADQLHYEAERQRELIDGAAFAEGVRAFVQKREPVFPPRSAG